jgi:hypothetical protein
MKVDSDIYSHGRLLLLTQVVTASLTTLGWRRLLHTIRRPRPQSVARHAFETKRSRFALNAGEGARVPSNKSLLNSN